MGQSFGLGDTTRVAEPRRPDLYKVRKPLGRPPKLGRSSLAQLSEPASRETAGLGKANGQRAQSWARSAEAQGSRPRPGHEPYEVLRGHRGYHERLSSGRDTGCASNEPPLYP